MCIYGPHHCGRESWIEIFRRLAQRSGLRSPVNVTAIVLGQGKLAPVPLGHGLGEKLEFARRRVVSDGRFLANHYAHGLAIFEDRSVWSELRASEHSRG